MKVVALFFTIFLTLWTQNEAAAIYEYEYESKSIAQKAKFWTYSGPS